MCHINYVTFCKIIYYDIVHLTNTSMNKIQKSHTYDILFCISKSQNVKLSINNLIKFEIKIVKILRCKCSEMIYLKESWRRPFNAAAFQCSGFSMLLLFNVAAFISCFTLHLYCTVRYVPVQSWQNTAPEHGNNFESWTCCHLLLQSYRQEAGTLEGLIMST